MVRTEGELIPVGRWDAERSRLAEVTRGDGALRVGDVSATGRRAAA